MRYADTDNSICNSYQNGVVQKVGKSTILQPKTNFKGGSIKWYEDKKKVDK